MYLLTIMESKTVLAASLQNLSNKSVWAILMTGGGHIAGTVFQGREVLQHKTFHRYTVRPKQGMAQGLQDGQNRNHSPKSTAAALCQSDIQDLLESWSEHLNGANAIFMKPPSYNHAMFIGARLLRWTGVTHATFREIKKVHEILATRNATAAGPMIHILYNK
ncbi:UNVERIFIED_CONTAM: hypothetical protein FKN15_038060 [Acipenser sinensis]